MGRVKACLFLGLMCMLFLSACSSNEPAKTPEQAAADESQQQLSAGDIDVGK